MTCIDQIAHLFHTHGHKTYGEACTQTTHAISTGLAAVDDGASASLIVAAFLHDIGHFLADEWQLADLDEWGCVHHDELGADWLQQQGFCADVYQPIRYHVTAKRYLASTQQRILSPASAATLRQQGGALSPDEKQVFKRHGYFDMALRLRAYDDAGKPSSHVDLSIEPWLERVESLWIENRR